jgi:hypothetical protein
MGLINPNKKYKKLITVGCSFTYGHNTRAQGTWGSFLSDLLDCEHETWSNSGSSNTCILNNVVNYCETQDLNGICIGIQWSEFTRREVWSMNNKSYMSFTATGLLDKKYEIPNVDISCFRENMDSFLSVWFDYKENILRTIYNMFLVKNYLESKKVDFIMFEGLGSILDMYYPSIEIENMEKDDVGQRELSMLKDNVKLKIFEDVTFFKKYGTMQKSMQNSHLYDESLNEGHPNIEFCKWWSKEIHNYLVENNVNSTFR